MDPARIMVVEDDPHVADVVVRYLGREGFQVTHISDGLEAVQAAVDQPPSLMVLDLMLPGLSGLEVCRRIREIAPIPVIMLTARGDEADRVTGLDLGADDYMAKPFSPRELTSRVKAVLRRSQAPVAAPPAPARIAAGDLALDLASREVAVRGQPVDLTALEFDLLSFFVRHPRRVFSREELLEQVWGYTYGDTSTVTVHIRRVREKIEADPSAPEHIVTVWGKGYRFDA